MKTVLPSHLLGFFLQAAELTPQKTALASDRHLITYQQLLQEVRETAVYYRHKGIGPGDRVVVGLPMGISLYRALLALWYLGACPALPEGITSFRQLEGCFKTGFLKGIVARPGLSLLKWRLPALIRLSASGKPSKKKPFFPPEASPPEAAALLVFTTGSTSAPQIRSYSHAALLALAADSSAANTSVSGGYLTTVPEAVLSRLTAGKSTLLPTARFNVAARSTYPFLLETIERQKAGVVESSPLVLTKLLDAANGLSKGLETVKEVQLIGEPVYPALTVGLQKGFPNARLTSVYTSTEGWPLSRLDGWERNQISLEAVLEKGVPVGVPGVAVRIVERPDADAMGSEAADAADQASIPRHGRGEIWFKDEWPSRPLSSELAVGSSVVQTAALEKPWRATGDWGWLDATGNLYFMGQASALFTWNGRRYYPDLIAYYLSQQLHEVAIAVFFYKEKPLVLFENAVPVPPDVLTRLLAFCHLEECSLAVVPHIPKSAHFPTQTDYKALEAMITKEALTWV